MNEDAYGYANALQASLSAHQEAIQSASEDLMKTANDLPNKIKEVGIGIGSKILGDAAGKLVGNVVGGVQKALAQGVGKATQAATKVVQSATTKILQQTGLDEEAGDDFIQMEPLGELETPVEGSANPTFVGEDADVVDELSGFGEQSGDVSATSVAPAAIQAPTNEAISAAGDVEEGLIPQEEAVAVPASQVLPTFSGTPIMPTLQGDDSLPVEEEIQDGADQAVEETAEETADIGSDLAQTGSDLAQTGLNTVTDLAQTGLNTLASAADDTIATAANVGSKVVSGVTSAITDATAVATDAAATGLEATGAALDATGVGSVVGVLLGIGGILASIFAPSDDSTPDLPPPPNFSYQAGA